MWGRGREGAMALAPLSAGLQSLPLLHTIKLGPSGADSRVGGLVHALGPCGFLRTSPVRLEFLLLPPQPPWAFSITGLRISPMLEPWVSGLLRSPPFVPVYLCVSVGPQGLLVVRLPAPFVPHSASLSPATVRKVLSTLAAHLRPS